MKVFSDLLLSVMPGIEETEVFTENNFCKPYRILR